MINYTFSADFKSCWQFGDQTDVDHEFDEEIAYLFYDYGVEYVNTSAMEDDKDFVKIDIDGGVLIFSEFHKGGELEIEWSTDNCDTGTADHSRTFSLPFAIHRGKGAFALTIYQL